MFASKKKKPFIYILLYIYLKLKHFPQASIYIQNLPALRCFEHQQVSTTTLRFYTQTGSKKINDPDFYQSHTISPTPHHSQDKVSIAWIIRLGEILPLRLAFMEQNRRICTVRYTYTL